MFREYEKNEIDNVAFEIKNKKACVLPTDTIMGIVSLNPNLIYKIKQRSRIKKIVLLVTNYDFFDSVNQVQLNFMKIFWPGQTTIVYKGLSYRIPNDEWLLLLLSKTGPLYCSSANVSNQKVISNSKMANEVFDSKWHFELVIVNATIENEIPSTVIDIDNWTILRKGKNIEQIEEFLNKNNIKYEYKL